MVGKRSFWFGVRVVRRFLENRGMLLAGGVGYNTLLSLVPLLAVTVSALSFIVDEARLVDTISGELRLLVPRHADAIVGAIQSFLASRELVGGIGFVVLLFISSLCFRMLEDAIGVIFENEERTKKKRPLWMSAVIPYAYVLALAFAIFLITVIAIGLDRLAAQNFVVFGMPLPVQRASRVALYAVAFFGLATLFTSIYQVLPVRKIRFGRAFVGGVTATVLWGITSRILVYYFTHLSLVGVVYGSLATVVVVLLSLEIAAIILLLGAQVIAELERSEAHGCPWYEEPRGDAEVPAPAPVPEAAAP